MKLLMFTTPTCGTCIRIKQQLKEKGVEFTEVSCKFDNPEAITLMEKYNVRKSPTMIDEETGKEVTVESLL